MANICFVFSAPKSSSTPIDYAKERQTNQLQRQDVLGDETRVRLRTPDKRDIRLS